MTCGTCAAALRWAESWLEEVDAIATMLGRPVASSWESQQPSGWTRRSDSPTTSENVMLKLILGLHVAAGTTALVSMWIPMFARKGASVHRKAGKVFVAAMAAVSITALVLAGARFLFDPRPQARQAGLFLLFVSVLTASAVSTGVRVLKAKQRTGPRLHWWDVGLAGLLAAASVAAAIYGIVAGATLFAPFAVIGLITGGGQLAYWLRSPRSPMHWWFEHMSSMLAACIAATTAFLVVNAQRFGADTFSFIVWLMPTVVGVPVIAIWTAYYRRRFDVSKARGARLEAEGSIQP